MTSIQIQHGSFKGYILSNFRK